MTRERIVAPELPRHRDHLAVALIFSLVLSLGGALAIVMLPAPTDNVRYLEAARMIRTRALEERERRHAFAPIVLPPSVPPASSSSSSAVAASTQRPLQPSDDDLIGEGFDDGLDREDDEMRELSRERERREQEAREERERQWAASDGPELAPHALDEANGNAFVGIDVSSQDSPLPLAPLPRKERAKPRAPEVPKEPEFICRLPDRDAVRAWFEDKVRPVLRDCMSDHMPAGEMRGSVTLSFDEKGRVSTVKLAHVDAGFAACAQPKLARLAHPDAFELTFTWPFVLVP